MSRGWICLISHRFGTLREQEGKCWKEQHRGNPGRVDCMFCCWETTWKLRHPHCPTTATNNSLNVHMASDVLQTPIKAMCWRALVNKVQTPPEHQFVLPSYLLSQRYLVDRWGSSSARLSKVEKQPFSNLWKPRHWANIEYRTITTWSVKWSHAGAADTN